MFRDLEDQIKVVKESRKGDAVNEKAQRVEIRKEEEESVCREVTVGP